MRGRKELSRLLQQKWTRIKKAMWGDPVYLDSQYQLLYGTRQTERVEEVLRKNIKRARWVLLLILMVLLSLLLPLDSSSDSFLYQEGEKKKIVAILRPDQGSIREELTASIGGENPLQVRDIPARIASRSSMKGQSANPRKESSEREEMELRRQLDLLLRDALRHEGNLVSLPSHTKEGSPIHWERKKESSWIYGVGVLASLGWMLVITRYQSLQRERKKAAKSVEGELPLFINQLVLLLNAGAIFESAFLEIIRKEKKRKETSYFYHQLEMIRIRYEETQDPLESQLNAFARRTDNRDFIRVAGILRDNIQRGIQLSEKLMEERNRLLYEGKKKVEEEIRIKETRLTMPLCLYLLVLITIAIAPAVLTT